MDIKAIMDQMMSGDALASLGKLTGTSQKDVKGVLSSALPSLLDGVKAQADGADTAEGFVGALSDHAKDNTSDISSFLSGVDLEDGGKIVDHLLGSDAAKTTETAAKSAGVEVTKAGNILSGAAPLLMSLLGQQTAENSESNNASGIGGLIGSLLSNVDVGNLLGGLLGGDSSSSSTTSTGKKKKKKKSDKKESDGLLDSLLGLFKG